MKAIINGVVEGTPSEILEYQRLVSKNEKADTYEKFRGIPSKDLESVIRKVEAITGLHPIVVGNLYNKS